MAVGFHIKMNIISKDKGVLLKIIEKHFKNGTFGLGTLSPGDFVMNSRYWWGTPEECFDGSFLETYYESTFDRYILETDFYTVWGIPIIPFAVLSTLYPDCRFEIFYNVDCDINNGKSIYVEGQLVFEDGKCE